MSEALLSLLRRMNLDRIRHGLCRSGGGGGRAGEQGNNKQRLHTRRNTGPGEVKNDLSNRLYHKGNTDKRENDLGALEHAALLLHEEFLELGGLKLHVLAPVSNPHLALVPLEALHLLACVKELHLDRDSNYKKGRLDRWESLLIVFSLFRLLSCFSKSTLPSQPLLQFLQTDSKKRIIKKYKKENL